MSGEPLVCPSCGGPRFSGEQRFCPACGLPLVPADPGKPPSERQQRARKVKPQYTEGPLVRVASAAHQAEAELIQNLLLEEGIPSMTRRSAGFDIPDFLAAGRRDVLVPRSGAAAARELLSQALAPLDEGESLAPSDGGEPGEV